MKIFKVLFGIIFLSLVGWNILALCKVYPPLIHEIMLLDKPKRFSKNIDVSFIVNRYIKVGMTKEESSHILKQQGFDVTLMHGYDEYNDITHDIVSIRGIYGIKENTIVNFLPAPYIVSVRILFKNDHVLKVIASYYTNLY